MKTKLLMITLFLLASSALFAPPPCFSILQEADDALTNYQNTLNAYLDYHGYYGEDETSLELLALANQYGEEADAKYDEHYQCTQAML